MKTKVLAIVLACTLAGCAPRVKHVTNLPPGVTEQQVTDWDKEVAALHKIAATTSGIRQFVIALEHEGAFPDTVAYVKTIETIAKVDQYQLAATEYLRQTPKTFGAPQKDRVKQLLTQIGGELNDLNTAGLLGVKNTNSKDQVTALIAEAIAAMNIGLSLTQ